jgi:2-keto-3-deoxy-L-rhamnonate aldolase RhmA
MSSVNKTLRSLMAQRAAVGTFLKSGRREVIEIAALAGFDFAICDLEHSQITEQECALSILAGLSADLPIVVRAPNLDAGLLNRMLEAGAAGIQLPHVRHKTEVAGFRNATKYAPIGSRSISLAQPAAAYGSEPLIDYIRRANEEVLLVGQLETRDLDRPLEQLVDGLDVAFIGILDLSVDMNVPGRFDDPLVVGHIAEIEAAAKSAKVPLGIYADSPARAAKAISAGYQYIALSSDLGALSGTFKSWIKQLQDPAANKL